MESLLQKILDVLKDIYKRLITEEKPSITQGGNNYLLPNTQASVYVEVPASWAAGWTLYVTPSDNYFSAANGKAVARLKTRISSGSGKGISYHNESPRAYDPATSPYFTNPGSNSDKWLDSRVVGEAFGIKGQKVTVDVRNVMTAGTDKFNFEVMAIQGLPVERDQAAFAFATNGLQASGVAIPRYATKMKLVINTSGYTVADLPLGGFVDANNAFINQIAASDWPLYAEDISFDSTGGIALCSKATKFIEIPPNAMGFKFNTAVVSASVTPVWKIVE